MHSVVRDAYSFKEKHRQQLEKTICFALVLNTEPLWLAAVWRRTSLQPIDERLLVQGQPKKLSVQPVRLQWILGKPAVLG